jgi:hypothetical protein
MRSSVACFPFQIKRWEMDSLTHRPGAPDGPPTGPGESKMRRLEQAPKFDRAGEQRLVTQLSHRMQTCFSVPKRDDERIEAALNLLAARLRRQPFD